MMLKGGSSNWCSICIALTLVANIAEADQTRRIVTTANSTYSCSVGTGNNRFTYSKRTFDIGCSDPGVVVHCDGPALEPLDISVGELCNSGQLSLVPAESVTVSGASGGEIIEWLELSTGDEVRIVARRSVEQPIQTLNVSGVAGRLVRISRNGFSPVTLVAGPLRANRILSIPAAVHGGELMILGPTAAVSPSALLLDSEQYLAPDSNELLAVQGLQANQHRLVPLYKGGLSGKELHLRVRSGESALVRLAREEVGAVVLSADAGCDQDTRISKLTTFDASANSIVLDPKGDFSSEGPCSWSVGGLEAGRYRASLPQGDNSILTDFEIIAQRTTTARFSPSAVQVSGTVRSNGQPYRAKPIRFQQLGDPSSGQTTTDDMGEYYLDLQKPGEYVVILGTGGVTRRVSLRPGPNVIDLDLSGGTIAVEVEGASTEVMVELRAPSKFSTHALEPGARHVWEGLAFGEYTVSARAPRSASETTRISISEASPSATARLRLAPNASEILIVDPLGHLVPEIVFPRVLSPPKQISTGRFLADSIPPGTELRIRPPNGLTPTCHIVRKDETKEVLVVQSQRAMISFEGIQEYQLGTDLGFVEGIPGAECSVPVRDLGVISRTKSDTGVRVEVENFPVAGMIKITTALGWRNVSIDLTGVVHVRLGKQ